MNILALDQSTKSTGWSVYENDILIAHGVIVASNSNVCKRITKIKNEVKQLIEKYKINKVFLEEILLTDCGNNHNVFKSLAWLQGNLCVLITECGLSYELIGASSWRSACGISTGRGIKRGSLKESDINFVKNTFNIDVGDDEADAIGIGYAATHKKKTCAF